MLPFRIGHGFDAHRLEAGLPLRLAGVNIEYGKGCAAHSDGDVAAHALCDALLGAASLGDIGTHFPDTSPEYKGIDSMLLLRRVAALLREKGYIIGNVDVTLLLQEPKVKPYIGKMRESLAMSMEIPEEAVSVKATTTERLGFVGQGEGVAAHAVALISVR